MAFRAFFGWTSVLLAASRASGDSAPPPAESDIKSVPLRTHSLQMPYLDNEMHSRWWDYGGSTLIRTDHFVRLTAEHASQAGWIYSRVPLTATNWEVEVEFRISGTGTLFGDGMAMWLTKERAEPGPVFGMRDRFEGLGLFFDTYKNNRPGAVFPYVMAMVGDGKTAYDQQNDGKANEVAGCSARGLRNPDLPITKARVTYFQGKNLTVDLMYKKEDEWTRCFDVDAVKLSTVAYLGFSAETGELSDNHDIYSVATKSLYSPSGESGAATSKAPSGTHGTKSRPLHPAGGEGGGWGSFFFKFVIFGLVLTGAYVGFTAYRARQRDRF